MLVIENFCYCNPDGKEEFKLNYSKVNKSSAVAVVGENVDAELFFNILTGRLNCSRFKMEYDEDEITGSNISSYITELGSIDFLYPRLTLKENIYYFAKKLNLDTNITNQKINWLQHFFDVAQVFDKKAIYCSAEERFIAHFFINILNIPKILIFNCDFPLESKLFQPEKYSLIFQDLQQAKTIFIYKNSWNNCFKDSKLELKLNRLV
jgi:ABC-type uncharacterized transport system ATPase subunit